MVIQKGKGAIEGMSGGEGRGREKHGDICQMVTQATAWPGSWHMVTEAVGMCWHSSHCTITVRTNIDPQTEPIPCMADVYCRQKIS